MITTDNTVQSYIKRANNLINLITQKVELPSELLVMFNDTLEFYKNNPQGDRNGEWSHLNVRYPYTSAIPGIISEIISIANILQEFENSKIIFAHDDISQDINNIDYWFVYNNRQFSVQVKTIRILKDRLASLPDKLHHITADLTSLVDIDERDHFLIPSTYNKHITTSTTRDHLISISVYYDNLKLNLY